MSLGRGPNVSNSKWYYWLLNADNLIFKMAVILIVMLINVQLLHVNDRTRLYISKVDRLEGDKITLEDNFYVEAPLQVKEIKLVAGSMRERRVLNLRLIKPDNSSEIKAIVNGKVIDDFHKGSVKVVVYDGDYVEIDAVDYKGQVQVVVNVLGDKIISPIDGLFIEGSSMVMPVGKVKLKN